MIRRLALTRRFALLRRFARSLSGRIAVILTIGMAAASIVSLMVSEKVRRIDIQHMRSERVLVGAMDLIERLRQHPGTMAAITEGRVSGAHAIPPGAIVDAHTPPAFAAALAERFPRRVQPAIAHAPPVVCQGKDPFAGKPSIAGFESPGPPDCWLVSMTGGDGVRRRVAIEFPIMPLPPSGLLNPLFLALIALASALLSVITASVAMAPLRRLSSAAARFGASIDAEPIAESGPDDVREALMIFNTMQAHVRESVRERTRVLAAISHDLQTPLTRLRLRLEQVEDEALRVRLISDLTATLTMVRRGLDLAHSGEAAEDMTQVDLESLLSSFAEDSSELGHSVHLVAATTAIVWVKPDALMRCLGNLVDNALLYGGTAEIACIEEDRAVVIAIRDDGPGIPPASLDQVFRPFTRGEKHQSGRPPGTGIGLTIARAQAATFDGEVALSNRPGGGLEATIRIPHDRAAHLRNGVDTRRGASHAMHAAAI